jgi:hypothetical protein
MFAAEKYQRTEITTGNDDLYQCSATAAIFTWIEIIMDSWNNNDNIGRTRSYSSSVPPCAFGPMHACMSRSPEYRLLPFHKLDTPYIRAVEHFHPRFRDERKRKG